MMEIARNARVRAELAGAQFRAPAPVDLAVVAAEIAVREHPIRQLAAQVHQVRGGWAHGTDLSRTAADSAPQLEEAGRFCFQLFPELLFPPLHPNRHAHLPSHPPFTGS